MKNYSDQKGGFLVEFAIVGVVFSMLLVFSMDVIIKLSIKGKLDRLSYSAVTILKERNELYAEEQNLTQSEANQIFQIVSKSLSRTLGSYEQSLLGVEIEKVKFESPVIYERFSSNGGCDLSSQLNTKTHLSIVTSWDRVAPLYRVTLCYETENIFGRLIGEEYTNASSGSVLIGR